ncbi:MAG TPA: hypothetical protein VM123_07020 [archaeon]|nr:hypothetical protein [archaeon]
MGKPKHKLAYKVSAVAFGIAVLFFAGCSVSMRMTLPGDAVDPEGVIGRLDHLSDLLQTNKQIFRVRLLEKGRTFSGDGALFYRAPDTLQLSIYGPPFTTLWMQMLKQGDSLIMVLPKENRVVRASSGDPGPVTRLAGSEGLTDAEFLGGVTGIFNIDSFRRPGMRAYAAVKGEIESLRLADDLMVYEFAYNHELEAVVHFVHYYKGQKQREILRSDFKEIGGLKRATKTVYRDYFEDREIIVLVGKEEVNLKLAKNAFQILLPDS